MLKREWTHKKSCLRGLLLAMLFPKSRFAKNAKRLFGKTKAARGAFFAKGAKNASWKERAKVKIKIKIKTLGDESPRPSLFF
ncbi:MAG: hypothetical protein H7834_01215 [Magnetococcus sp. YQC-9]